MVPPEKKLEQVLVAAVREVLGSGDRDDLTVNYIRKRVQDKLDLPADFFKQGDWKLKSKDLITNAVNQFHAEEDTAAAPSSQPEPTAKHYQAKRHSSAEPSPPPKPKRAKREAAPKPAPTKKNAPKNKKKAASSSDLGELDDLEEEPKKPREKAAPANPNDSESALSDLGSMDEPESDQEKKQEPRKTAGRRKNRFGDGEDAATSFHESSATRKRKRAPPATKKARAKRATSESEPGDASEAGRDGPESAGEDEVDAASSFNANTAKATGKDSSQEQSLPSRPAEESKPTADDDSSEMSSVIDEPLPKRKRKAKEPKQPKAKATGKAAPKEPTGDDAEIRKLQSQLVKCGVRKIWGFELKQYGDDCRAKLRHLRKMLSDVGMTGRFSEARAKEIKEQRELMADLEAVQEMDSLWGGAGGPRGRASRSKAKTAVQAKPEDGSVDDGAATTKPRVSKRMADLAFLGSESESE